MTWQAVCGVCGWHVQDGEPYESKSWATFQPNQFGRVTSMGLVQHNASFPKIQIAAGRAKDRFIEHRFGTRHSIARRDLCRAIAEELNKTP